MANYTLSWVLNDAIIFGSCELASEGTTPVKKDTKRRKTFHIFFYYRKNYSVKEKVSIGYV